MPGRTLCCCFRMRSIPLGQRQARSQRPHVRGAVGARSHLGSHLRSDESPQAPGRAAGRCALRLAPLDRERAGYKARTPRKEALQVTATPVEMKRDKQAAAQRAAQLRAQRLSLRDIGAQLPGEGRDFIVQNGSSFAQSFTMDLAPDTEGSFMYRRGSWPIDRSRQ